MSEETIDEKESAEANTEQAEVLKSLTAEACESDDSDVLAKVSTKALEQAEIEAAELSEEERLARIQVLKPIIEGAILAAGETVKLARLQSLFDEHEIPSKGMLLDVFEQIKLDCVGRGFNLVEVASGWRFQVREDYASWVNRLWEEKPQKYSRALLETLALVAYRQPLTRGDIEEVRGVAVSSHIIKTLVERDWVKVVGHRDVPGRPALYATTKQFLDYFNLKSLEELPTLGELKDIDSLNKSLELEGENALTQEDEQHLKLIDKPVELDSEQAPAFELQACEEKESTDRPEGDEPLDTNNTIEIEDAEALDAIESEGNAQASHDQIEETALDQINEDEPDQAGDVDTALNDSQDEKTQITVEQDVQEIHDELDARNEIDLKND